MSSLGFVGAFGSADLGGMDATVWNGVHNVCGYIPVVGFIAGIARLSIVSNAPKVDAFYQGLRVRGVIEILTGLATIAAFTGLVFVDGAISYPLLCAPLLLLAIDLIVDLGRLIAKSIQDCRSLGCRKWVSSCLSR